MRIMPKKIFFILVLIATVLKGYSQDTLYTNPNYPPLVYSNAELKFYKYTAKYIPSNLLHAFKILGTNDSDVIDRFINRSEAMVIKKGLFYTESRLRKEFCLSGFSDFTLYFHDRGIYYPRAMETYILLSFHQYLKQEEIDWSRNKTLSLSTHRKSNRIWKKRKRKLFKPSGVKVKESRGKNRKKKLDPEDFHGTLILEEFEEK